MLVEIDPVSIFLGILISILSQLIIVLLARTRGWTSWSIRIMRGVVRLHKRLIDYGVSNLYASRVDYVKFRTASTLPGYLSLAKKTIKIAGIWMAEGVETEGVADTLMELVRPPNDVDITIALVNPKGKVIEPLALYMDLKPSELRTRITNSLMRLYDSKDSLGPREKGKFKIKVYDTLPVMSVILIDSETEKGIAQIDVKPYKTPRRLSFGLELKGQGKPLYDLIVKAYERLIEESEEFDPLKHTEIESIREDKQ
jgi:hypothetical protein